MSARNRRVLLADQAQSDLRDILNFTGRQWGSAQRTVYRRLIDKAMRTLALSPSLGRTRDDLSTDLRSYPAGSHLLYYLETDDVLVVLRILHSRQDPTRESWEQPPKSE
jgi:toxin ParE1/3/4